MTEPVWMPLAQVPPDTPLAADLRGEGGVLLLPAGTVLSEAVRLRLERKGIDQVAVRPPPPPVDSPEALAAAARQAAALAELEARLTHLFRLAGDSPAATLLHGAVFAYRRQHPLPGPNPEGEVSP